MKHKNGTVLYSHRIETERSLQRPESAAIATAEHRRNKENTRYLPWNCPALTKMIAEPIAGKRKKEIRRYRSICTKDNRSLMDTAQPNRHANWNRPF